MDQDIQPITRESIAAQVRHALSMGTADVNPYRGTEHEAAWEATLIRIRASDEEGGSA
jgi:hypothetical protein